MFTTTDPRGYIISCSTERFNEHIVSGHVIMRDNLNAIKSTIEEPEVIYKSSQSPIRDVYFSKVPTSSYPKMYTKVVVQIDDGNMTGEVVSAWPQKDISGGIDSGGIVYVKNKLR
ncbi:hypothetical protein [Thermotalea metallivorans]|uniref:Uncharacterized protein n=1 Tax=Thermotalea metallivorans TaxID=520762 RepID=A0A140LCN1_9FIRM|nr:hypothetical protein [Thermotalea metallivorans]KXG78306.1 hypothetical protein AN619_02810 [Thermotalea metallivorans]